MNSKEIRGLMEAYAEVYAPQQIDELSVNKMHDYINKAEKDRDRLNKKWDQGTATPKERKKVFDREEGEARASKKIRQKTGKDPFKLNALDKLKSAVKKEELDIFDVVLEFLQAEGFAETLEEAEWLMANMIDEEAIDIILEITGGKGHPGYKAGSKDHGPMQSGHPADSEKRKDKGGTMSQRHGYHLGDIDDDDDDDDGLESVVKQQSRDSRERTRKPLRAKVKAARKVLSKEEFVDEAQHARENPEKYEREQSKKSAPVRGEKTPMPPRGDKRREDFEKWYAKQMGR